MSISNLTREELDQFLQDPNRFLANPQNAQRVLGLTPATVAVIQENMIRRGMTAKQIDTSLQRVMSVTELITSIIKKIGKEQFRQVERFVRVQG